MAIRPAKLQTDGHIYSCPDSGLVVPSVTQVLMSVGLVDYRFVKEAVLNHKSDIGSEVHDLCSFIDRGENLSEYEYDPRLQPFLDSYHEFKTAKNWRPTLIEYGPNIADVAYMPVGFTVDRVGMIDSEESVAELKCTATDQPSHSIQLAGYDMCLGGGKRRARYAIRLQPDGKMAKLSRYKDQSEYGVFLSALTITHWKRNHGLNGNNSH